MILLDPLAWAGEHLTVPLLVLLAALVAYLMHTDPVNQPSPQDTP